VRGDKEAGGVGNFPKKGWFRETFQNTGKTDMVRYM
jgi:hypothetical protein